jgi:sterol desaturase/sphingolipid hydroxylase (fatty acid hydroxylase superfamily)
VSVEQPHYNKNFSMHLVIFDLMFGTLYMPPNEKRPSCYGLPEPFPEGLWGS